MAFYLASFVVALTLSIIPHTDELIEATEGYEVSLASGAEIWDRMTDDTVSD